MSYLTGNISSESRPKQIPALFKPKETQMEDKEKAAKIARLREKAKDKTLPQDVRNQFLDNANKLEQEMGGMKYAKGGVAKKKMMMGGAATKLPAARMAMNAADKAKAMAAPQARMAKGGYAKKGKK